MNIRVFNTHGYQIILPQQLKTSLNNIGLEAEKPNADWNEITHKMLRVLEGYDFDVTRLQPEIAYYETKGGKKISSIDIKYTG